MNIRQIQDDLLGLLWVLHAQHIDPLEHLEDPSHGRALGRLSHLIRQAFSGLLQALPQFSFSQSIDQQGQSHDHDQRHDPFGGFQKETVGKEHRILQEPKTPLRTLVLASVLPQHLLRR